MPIKSFAPKRGIWFTGQGELFLDRHVIAHVGWVNHARVEPFYIEKPYTLIVRTADQSDSSVQLRYTSPDSANRSGAVVKHKRMTRYSGYSTEFPSKVFYPIFPTNGLADVAFFVEEPSWIEFLFNRTSVKELPADTIGVYALHDRRSVLRYGEGNLRERMNQHLEDSAFAEHVVEGRYFIVQDKEESEVLEHLLLSRHQQQNKGALPKLQRIKA